MHLALYHTHCSGILYYVWKHPHKKEQVKRLQRALPYGFRFPSSLIVILAVAFWQDKFIAVRVVVRS